MRIYIFRTSSLLAIFMVIEVNFALFLRDIGELVSSYWYLLLQWQAGPVNHSTLALESHYSETCLPIVVS